MLIDCTRRSSRRMIEGLKRAGADRRLWFYDSRNRCLFVHHALLEKIPALPGGDAFHLLYFSPSISDEEPDDFAGASFKLNRARTVYIDRNPRRRIGPLSHRDMLVIKRHFIERLEPGAVSEIMGFDASRLIRKFRGMMSEFEVMPDGFDAYM
jgi:hypothetical protein